MNVGRRVIHRALENKAREIIDSPEARETIDIVRHCVNNRGAAKHSVVSGATLVEAAKLAEDPDSDTHTHTRTHTCTHTHTHTPHTHTHTHTHTPHTHTHTRLLKSC